MALLLILQVFDFYTTLSILQNGGKELNKFLAWFIAHIGLVPTLVLYKGGYAALIWYSTVTVTSAQSTAQTIMLAGFCALYAVVIKFNYRSMPR